MGDIATQNLNTSGEEMMRGKYPSAAAGRSALLEKRLSRGVPKFFDSGDYNLAKAAKDPKHKNRLDLGYPLAVHSSSASPGVDKKVSPIFTPVNPLTPPSTPIDGTSPTAAAVPPSPSNGAAAAAVPCLIDNEEPVVRKARPPSAIDLHHRRISRQPSRLADADPDVVANDLDEALRDLQRKQPQESKND